MCLKQQDIIIRILPGSNSMGVRYGKHAYKNREQ